MTTTTIFQSPSFRPTLLKLTQGESVYECMRMTSDNDKVHRVLAMDQRECWSDLLETLYAHNLLKYFYKTMANSFACGNTMLGPDAMEGRDEALLLATGEQGIEYGTMSQLNERGGLHRMLATDLDAERSDCCSDATDTLYAIAMANYFASKTPSSL
ncbi:hypothetical protein CCR75_000373 [Bremia lactucae]|uniref:Uncharacterized protein n=1 Tax=Bremia lactucae TaxID=4779 RepID=A0A976FPE8_BRELC|nr:hypothetical protein CCR75_000373 [Bremia lactucae]